VRAVLMRKSLGTLSLLTALCAGLHAQPARTVDVTSFVVLGGGWSAGYAEFQLLESRQRAAFPTLMAEAMETVRPQPLFRPLVGPSLLAVNPLPGILPATGQSVLRSLPFPLFAFNVSIPWVRVEDSLRRPPAAPLVRERDFRQTLVNLVLGYPHLILEQPPLWTQVEYAERMSPTLVLIQMGLGDVLEGAVAGDPALITPSSAFAADFSEIAERMRRTFAEVVVLTVPNPLDAPYFLDLTAAADLLGFSTAELKAGFGLRDLDRITPAGLVQISDFVRGRGPAALTSDAVLPEAVVWAVDEAVSAYNATIRAEASRRGFLLYDLNALTRQVRESGVEAGSRRLGGGLQEGFYSSDGLFPSPTAHAVIANQLLLLLNATYSRSFNLVDVDTVAARDPFPTSGPHAEKVRRDPDLRLYREAPALRGPREQRGRP
jgi:hypothetical protein